MTRTPAEVAAKAVVIFRKERWQAGGDYTPLDEAQSALSALEREGYVVVPKSALDWLNGEAPDHEGKWFGECEGAVIAAKSKFSRRYWWRSKFRALCDLSARPQDGGGA